MINPNSTLFGEGSFVDGQWLSADKRFAVTDKASGKTMISLADASPEDMQLAIESASEAFESWSVAPASQRSQCLQQWAELVQQYKSELARLLTLEQGKPLNEAAAEIDYGCGYITWFAAEALRINGDILPASKPGQQIQVVKKPVGVVGAITPWNFPHAMIARKAAAALAAGCTFVVRPSEQTPLSALAMASLAQQAGIPDGVLNVVIGTDAKGLGRVLTQSPLVKKFSFTGSTAVGRQLTADCATTIKRVSMELGGNAPFIVFDDADIDAAVEGAMIAKFRNAGQTCVCANRFLVADVVADEFVEKLKTRMAKLRLGPGVDDVDLGPLISEAAAAGVEQLVNEALDQGASLATKARWQHDHFYPPTMLTGVTPSMAIAKEEIFGPVVAVSTFTDEAQAIAMANDTDYGLAGYFYSRDAGRIERIAAALDVGMVGINDGAISNPVAPFGGVKQSGYGREGSKYGLDDYLSLQYRCLGGL